MQAGFAAVDITPPLGAEMPGSFNKRHATGVHDPLHAKAAVFEDSAGTRVALVGVDCLSLKHSTVEKARALAEEWTGIPGDHILCAASHTHSGGPTADCLGSESDPAYLDWLSRQIASAVALANAKRVEARVGLGVGREETVAFNRRFKMRDGRQATHPGKGNPDIVEPAGPTDPAVGVVGAWAEDGRFLGCVVNFSCHCTVMGGTAFSADYPYYLDEAVRAVWGREAVSVFTNGACGDVTQVDNLTPREREFGEKWARRIGYILGAEVTKVLVAMEPGELEPLTARQTVIHLQPRPVSPERLAEAKRLLEAGEVPDRERAYARELVLLDELNRREPQVPCEIQALALGDAVFISDPAEFFCQFGLDLKAGSPFPHTFVVSLANGMIGYVPTPEAMGPHGGGYETRLARSSKLGPEAGPRIVEASLQLLREMPVPPPKSVPAFPPEPPWDAGLSGPENV
ncbi:MAG TPA: hypothetical protein EYP85_17185 [Armatimonadetes bacterium]|nr:hypothetical protein [Armatimonadota bacterium]